MNGKRVSAYTRSRTTFYTAPPVRVGLRLYETITSHSSIVTRLERSFLLSSSPARARLSYPIIVTPTPRPVPRAAVRGCRRDFLIRAIEPITGRVTESDA